MQAAATWMCVSAQYRRIKPSGVLVELMVNRLMFLHS